jgi:outer membrane biosynthesis protein TonB
VGSVYRRPQDAKIERKLLTRVEPDYPRVLRMRQIGGTVRLEVLISKTNKFRRE